MAGRLRIGSAAGRRDIAIVPSLVIEQGTFVTFERKRSGTDESSGASVEGRDEYEPLRRTAKGAGIRIRIDEGGCEECGQTEEFHITLEVP